MGSKGKMRLLDQWAEIYSDLARRLETHCQSLSAEELDELEAASCIPTETNCWWAVYRVAPMVRTVVQMERTGRERAAVASEV